MVDFQNVWRMVHEAIRNKVKSTEFSIFWSIVYKVATASLERALLQQSNFDFMKRVNEKTHDEQVFKNVC